jgi:alpha-glucosidase
VQDALLDVVRFWLDRGVDGFRLDTINFYFHDKELRDNPPLRPSCATPIAPEVNPYNWQDHLYDKNQPENLEFLKRFRALLDEYPAPPPWARWATRRRAADPGRVHRRRRQGAHVLFLRVPVGHRPTRNASATVVTDFDEAIRRLGLLGVLQP